MTQKEAIKIMKSGRSVFLTGAPGAGKTYTLLQFIKWARKQEKRVAVTASTGIAASHLGGLTIHSWAGIGIQESINDEYLDRLSWNRRLVKRMRKTEILIIDEISMLHGRRLDMINQVTQYIRNDKRPFGGLQVILVGDLFQLPPVDRDNRPADFAHLSDSWRALGLRICYITEQHRQAGDDPLINILQAMRLNTVSEIHRKVLEERQLESDDKITRLFTHNVNVDVLNDQRLASLPGKPKKYRMSSGGDLKQVEALMRNILAPEILELKVGAQVMFVANNFNGGYVNGTRGEVVEITKSGVPVVELQNGRRIAVEPYEWQTWENDHVIASVEQIPLRLAWAITVHKSQGMTLDSAQIDLSRSFTPGMGYVALSRVRSLDGLFLSGLNDMALKMHDDIYAFDSELQELSDM